MSWQLKVCIYIYAVLWMLHSIPFPTRSSICSISSPTRENRENKYCRPLSLLLDIIYLSFMQEILPSLADFIFPATLYLDGLFLAMKLWDPRRRSFLSPWIVHAVSFIPPDHHDSLEARGPFLLFAKEVNCPSLWWFPQLRILGWA